MRGLKEEYSEDRGRGCQGIQYHFSPATAAIRGAGGRGHENHLRNAIASWLIEAVVNGIAIFEGKKNAGTFPKGVDARYLEGIVHNLAEESESWAIAMALLTERLKAKDLSLAHLEAQQGKVDDEGAETPDLLKDHVDKALVSSRNIVRTF